MEEADEEEWRYRVEVSIVPLSDEEWVDVRQTPDGFQIGSCGFKMTSLHEALQKMQTEQAVGWSKGCTDIGYPPTGEGVSLSLWLPTGLERTEYQILCRQAAGAIRHYIRSVILDSKSIKEGLEETD